MDLLFILAVRRRPAGPETCREQIRFWLVYLLLAQDQQALGLDGMIWRQVLPAPPLDSVLKSLPDAVAGCPGHADVVPLAVVDEERQLRHLQQANA